MGRDPEKTDIKLYDKSKYDFGEKKAFPMREQHFFTNVDKVSVTSTELTAAAAAVS